MERIRKESDNGKKGMEEAEVKTGCRSKDAIDAIGVVKRSCAPALRRHIVPLRKWCST